VQQDLKDAYRSIYDSGEDPRDDNGMTALDKARLFLKPNQIKRAELVLDEARSMYSAISPLRSMTDQEAVSHIAKLQGGSETGERAQMRRRVSDAAEAAWAEIAKERKLDPAEAVDPYTNVRTKRAGQTNRADEVTQAYELVKRRLPNVQVNPTAAGAFEIADADPSNPDAVAAVHRARRMVAEARIEAQARLRVPVDDRKPITQREADEILQLPKDTATLNQMPTAEYRMRLDQAAARAESKYGKEFGPIVLQAALSMRKAGDTDHKDARDRLVKRMLRGDSVSTSEIRKLNDLQNLELRMWSDPWDAHPPVDVQDRQSAVPGAPPQPSVPLPERMRQHQQRQNAINDKRKQQMQRLGVKGGNFYDAFD